MYYAASLVLFGAATEIVSPFKALKAFDTGADIVKAGVRVADTEVLKAGAGTADNVAAKTGSGLTTIGESAGIGKTGITLNDLKAAQPGVDNFWTNFSEKTWSGYTTYYPAGTLDNYMTILAKQSPWLGETMPAKMTLQPGDKFYMVLNEGQDKIYPGGFGVKENIPNIEFVRKDLAIKQEWKNNPTKVIQYEVINPFDVNYGAIGPQIDLKANKFLPGNTSLTQYELPFYKGMPSSEKMGFIKPIQEIDIK